VIATTVCSILDKRRGRAAETRYCIIDKYQPSHTVRVGAMFLKIVLRKTQAQHLSQTLRRVFGRVLKISVKSVVSDNPL